MQNAFKLLYNNLWIAKSEDPQFLKDVTTANISSELNVSNISQKQHLNSNININSLTAELQSLKDLKSEMLDDKMTLDSSAKTSDESIALKTENKELIGSWNKLTDLINNCTNCRLCNTRKNLVIERGNRNSSWMFIGEAPGENEDVQGVPFVGSAGELLDKMLLAMKLDKDQDVYICNTVKCRPPQNRNPEPDEINTCNTYLLSQINLVKPKLIVTLGRIAAHTVLKTTQATSKLRNQVHYIESNIPVIVTYHPAYLLRNPAAKKDTWEDLQLAMRTFSEI